MLLVNVALGAAAWALGSILLAAVVSSLIRRGKRRRLFRLVDTRRRARYGLERAP